MISGDFLLLPADSLIEFQVQSAAEEHLSRNHLVTAIVCGAWETKPLNYSQVAVGGTGRPRSEEACLETGVYLFNRQVLEFIPPETRFDILSQLLPALSAAGQPVGAHILKGYWNPLATFDDLRDAQQHYLSNALQFGADFPPEKNYLVYPFMFARQYAPGIWVGKNHSIHSSVRLAPPVLLGDNIRIGQGACVGPEAVIGKNVIISDEATIQDSTILDDTYIGKLVHIDSRLINKNLIIDYCTSEFLRLDDRFLLRRTPHSLEHSIFGRITSALWRSRHFAAGRSADGGLQPRIIPNYR